MHAKYEACISLYGSKVTANVKVYNRQTNRQDKNNIPYMPYVPAGQKNPGILIPQNPSRRDAIFPVKFALTRNPCGLSNALHIQTSGLAK